MKTSSKLLIILGIALFILPVGGMVYYAKISRVNTSQFSAALELEERNINTKDRFLVSREVKLFNKVIIQGTNNLYTKISIVQSDQPKVKFAKNTESLFRTSVDASGTLSIAVDSVQGYQYSAIYVFVPHIDSLSLEQLQVSEFDTNFENMNIYASNINNQFNFGENSSLKSLQLTIHDSRISIGSSNQVNSFLKDLQNFDINVNNSAISIGPSSYNTMHVDLKNSSLNFIIEKRGDEANVTSVKDLQINSHGTSRIVIPEHAVEIGKLTGSLSDSTTIDLPYYKTKSLFNQ
ncbi:hypothetical protein [Sphingobacterium sp. JB170]|uniref:hypothetical protein n=1 Tax=Sphingobacterium sp. JB170 TaxID=1434842 RepID=UPI00097F1D1B|nr:hypothetical protein [Sphingobacterium sp. JB170]SJN48754.1 hypothetical protein FM107_17610 [Sphingobacterium sp. JB170]